ncbi:ATP-binding protein [Ktedonosporobacter rubrisoli]|uniref:ATP-binding protein n=1 Tax=Ktedonosporobacter rubrisoli TaxID=2509675 RepID=A0A4P6JJL3_KTERU|nr:AAA family ATPase [Ktedonosporobacter rubrisoli]QBD75327.1 ATP-binding protein [Ktedonosporobacter rubrisoli]
MNNKAKNESIGTEFLVTRKNEASSSSLPITFHMQVQRLELLTRALRMLWHELELDGEPLIFIPPVRSMYFEHHPMLLDKLVASGQQRKRQPFGQLASWRRLESPPSAYQIANVEQSGSLLKSNMQERAEPGDRHTIPDVPTGWICYRFTSGWTALSVYFDYDNNDNNEDDRLVALPAGRQDEWLAFLDLLDSLHDKIVRGKRKGEIVIVGGDDDLAEVIEKTSFDDVVLPQETLDQVAAQRHIFDRKMLSRYAALHVPRLRKVLLIGPPGTGKTTLLKAEGARHAKRGGLVIYVCGSPADRGDTSWRRLASALRDAQRNNLPALVLVEDFEMFVSDQEELQTVLNTLDGVATPDNPAGTLLLATSNDPERIDPRIRDRPGRIDAMIEIGPVKDAALAIRFLQRFLGSTYREEEHASLVPALLGQVGSHFREVCITGAIYALEQGREHVLRADLVRAHEVILKGRTAAADLDRFQPSPARERGPFPGRK